MSLHKLTAGSGYDYLTRQVAVLDATEKGHTGLASYYTERGETPGVWVGSGCAGIRPGFTGSIVTQEQMQALFGAGMNPVGAELVRQLGPDAPTDLVDAALRLGVPFRLKDGASPFRIEVAKRIAEFNASRGIFRDAVVSLDDRARIRTEVARELFAREFGRPPSDARELAGTIARLSRPAGTAVAGFDLTFSPPKSVSTLWAVADRQTAGRIEKAHQDAVLVALRFVERNLLYSREGTRGVRQVDVEGLVAASFTHRDTRAGDPDLHTHVAVANKVRTRGTGKWLSIDGRVLYQGAVAASETYNTALVKLLERQGLHFEDRPSPDGRRPVREIAGVSAELNRRWSSRRADIETRREQLAAEFQRSHGRPPTVVESVKLAQQATLETRDAKHEPRSLAEQRAVWHAQAVVVLGGEGPLRSMIERAVGIRATSLERADAVWFERSADHIITTMEARAATWQNSHLRADGADPSSLLTSQGPDALAASLDQSVPMARLMIDERIANLPIPHALDEAVRVTAARPADQWDADSQHIADQLLLPDDEVRARLVPLVQAWNRSPREAAADALLHDTEVRRRIQATALLTRWSRVAMQVDPRLTTQPDWPALEAAMQRAHDDGHDVEQAVRLLASPDQPNNAPATRLRARLTLAFGVTAVTQTQAEVRRPAGVTESPSTGRRHSRLIR